MENTGQDIPIGKHINPVIAGLAGAAIGAGVAVVTSKVLTDKKMRKGIMETFSHTVSRAKQMSNSFRRGRKKGGR